MSTLSGWKPDTNFVQQGVDNRQFVNAKYSLIAVGPPRLGQLGGLASVSAGIEAGDGQAAIGELVHPLGLVQQMSLGQNKQIARFFEIGSDRSYFIPGRSVGQLSLGRVYMHGPSLLRMLYAAFKDEIAPVTVESMITGGSVASNPHDVIVPPGYENVFMNLGSDLFDQFLGLLWYIKDNNKRPMGAMYFESVNVPNHGLQTDAQGVVFSENVGLQYDRMVPVKLGTAYPLISARTPRAQVGYDEGYPGLG
jgi:hypothetical protein